MSYLSPYYGCVMRWLHNVLEDISAFSISSSRLMLWFSRVTCGSKLFKVVEILFRCELVCRYPWIALCRCCILFDLLWKPSTSFDVRCRDTQSCDADFHSFILCMIEGHEMSNVEQVNFDLSDNYLCGVLSLHIFYYQPLDKVFMV